MDGKLLRDKRKALHLSQTDLAKLAGISTITVANIEKGMSTPNAFTEKAIYKALAEFKVEEPYGKRVREARKAKAMTIDELAFQAGISFTTLCNIEIGNSHPREVTRNKLEDLLGKI